MLLSVALLVCWYAGITLSPTCYGSQYQQRMQHVGTHLRQNNNSWINRISISNVPLTAI